MSAESTLAQCRLSPPGNALDLAALADVEHALQGAISPLDLARATMAYQRSPDSYGRVSDDAKE